MRWMSGLLREEEAATAVEYAVMLALVLMVVIGAIGAVGAQSGGMWGGIDSELSNYPTFGSPDSGS